ncbi:tyrosine-type recombinase/integrase [Rhodospira trueperi]|uniref:Site-specific recombinase XerD n=1 Tax=Rhodospira trueperi TaxID=69960 RepID=A0A1G7EM09_9PROT|nr:site-specific integrase [Rhodospira trueperi]SDE64647.1 Site-specific recombinase XerD [Rhodospira trueperi]
MPRLTKRVVEGAPVPAKATYLWDDQLPGFGVKVLPSGQRRYLVKYRANGGGRSAPQRWFTLGTHGAVTLEQARDMAQQVLAAVARGLDPQADKLAVREAPIMEELWARYEADHLPRKKQSSQSDDRQKWSAYIAPRLARKKVHLVGRDDIFGLHKEMADRPYQANRVLALLSKLFNLAERWDMRPDGSNPCRHVPRYKEQSRERYLTADELGRLGEALDAGLEAQTETPHMVAAIKLLLLTGARLNEILTAEWAWVDIDRRIIALPDSKTGRKPLYLSTAAVEVLHELKRLSKPETRFVIEGRFAGQPLTNLSKPWKRICERAGIEGVRLHDLRHTAASIGVAQGMNLPVIGRLLGHTQASTTHRYAHVDIDPALAAADRIGAVISGAMARTHIPQANKN